MPCVRRRALLAGLASTGALPAGCLGAGTDDPGDPGTDTPTSTATATATATIPGTELSVELDALQPALAFRFDGTDHAPRTWGRIPARQFDGSGGGQCSGENGSVWVVFEFTWWHASPRCRWSSGERPGQFRSTAPPRSNSPSETSGTGRGGSSAESTGRGGIPTAPSRTSHDRFLPERPSRGRRQAKPPNCGRLGRTCRGRRGRRPVRTGLAGRHRRAIRPVVEERRVRREREEQATAGPTDGHDTVL